MGMSNIDWGRRVLIAARLNIIRFARLTWKYFIPFAKLSMGYVGRFLISICNVVRPTLFHALCANRKISNYLKSSDLELSDWQAKLRDTNYKEREYAVNTLFSLFDSDQNRIRSVEHKARGVMQTAGLVFTGDAIVINLALREETPSWIIWLVAASGVYLLTALVASLYVEKPTRLHVLDPDNVLPVELAGSELVTSIELNRRGSIARTNLTESAIFDVARALFLAFIALLVALSTV